MKRILPAGERYGLFFAQLDGFKLHKIIHVTISTVAFLFLFSSIANAQIAETNNIYKLFRKEQFSDKFYQVGDKLPKNFILGYNPFDSTEVYTLADFRGKAVIIDIWATWCGSCISAFPKVDSLLKIYESKLSILLINVQQNTPNSHGDNPDKVREFITNYRIKYPEFSVNFFIEKNRLQNSFSFTSLPHYIWIDRNRRIRALSSVEEIRAENFELLLTGRPMDLPIKKR